MHKGKIYVCNNCGSTVSDAFYEVRCGCPVCGEVYSEFKDNPEDVREKYTNKFKDVMDEILELARGAKTSDYGETWRETGLLGIYIKLFIKEGRLHNLLWKQSTLDTEVNGESVRDTLMDMAAYSIYGIIALDENNITGSNIKEDKLIGVLNDLEEILGELQQ